MAGFAVTGVDIVERQSRPQGVEFIKADALDVLADTDYLRTFTLVHASPPCKVHTRLTALRDAQGGTAVHPDLLDPTRDALEAAGVPYIIENVEGAPMRPDVTLCGSMFGLQVQVDGHTRWLKRHRLFELGGWGNHGLGIQPECAHPRALRPLGVYGSMGDSVPDGGQTCPTLDHARRLLGAPWLSWAAATQAIPPAYTRHLGLAFLDQMEASE